MTDKGYGANFIHRQSFIELDARERATALFDAGTSRELLDGSGPRHCSMREHRANCLDPSTAWNPLGSRCRASHPRKTMGVW